MSQLKRQSNFNTGLLHAVKDSWNRWRSHVLKVHPRLLMSMANCVTQLHCHRGLVDRHRRVSEKLVSWWLDSLFSPHQLYASKPLVKLQFPPARWGGARHRFLLLPFFFFGNSTAIIREMWKHSIYFGTESIYSGTHSIYFGIICNWKLSHNNVPLSRINVSFKLIVCRKPNENG